MGGLVEKVWRCFGVAAYTRLDEDGNAPDEGGGDAGHGGAGGAAGSGHTSDTFAVGTGGSCSPRALPEPVHPLRLGVVTALPRFPAGT
jgi:hypothetical protein